MTLKPAFNVARAFIIAVAVVFLLGVVDTVLIHTGHPRSPWTLLAFALLAGGGVLLYRKWPWSWPRNPPPKVVP